MMYDFKFADIGEGIHEGQILKWYFKVGDKVKEGDTLVVVETDKVNAELPAPVDGIIVKRGPEEGETIHVGETVVVIDDGTGGTLEEAPKVEPIKEEKSEDKSKAAPSVIGAIEVSEDVIASSYESDTEAQTETKKALATPAARYLAKTLNIDINQVNGTGENGRVLKEDIQNFGGTQMYERPKVAVSAQGEVEYMPLSKLRKAIVKSMTLSKQIIPHTVLMDEVIVDKLVQMRNESKGHAEKQGIKLTYMAFVIKAIVKALKKHPLLNASYDEVNDRLIIKKYINIGMAVDTPDGLIVPNIKDADQLSILELAREIRTLADQTIARKVQLSQLQNTTFSITNFGAADVSHGTPIINHPELGIFGMGKIIQKAVVIDGEIKAAYVLPISLAVDHRIIDGADAGRFLSTIKSLLNEPLMLLLD